MAKMYYMHGHDGDVIRTAHPNYWPDYVVLSDTEGRNLMKGAGVKRLQEILQGVSTIYGIVRSVSASGMSRRIDLYVIKDNRPVYLSGYAANVLGWKLSDKGGVTVQGCGMDMIFHFATSMLSACGIDYKSIRVETL